MKLLTASPGHMELLDLHLDSFWTKSPPALLTRACTATRDRHDTSCHHELWNKLPKREVSD